MTSPFKFKYPLPPQVQPTTPSTPSTQLSARNFILSHRQPNTPASSVTIVSPGDDIDDSDVHNVRRKRRRFSSFHAITSDDDEELVDATSSSVTDTPVTKRPPVILPQPSPQSPTIDFSPSRRQPFQPNGLAAYTARIIHEHSALSSVALPHLDREDDVVVTKRKLAEGVGYICLVETEERMSINVLLLTPKGLNSWRNVDTGDTISISNAVKLDPIWICASWHHKTV